MTDKPELELPPLVGKLEFHHWGSDTEFWSCLMCSSDAAEPSYTPGEYKLSGMKPAYLTAPDAIRHLYDFHHDRSEGVTTAMLRMMELGL